MIRNARSMGQLCSFLQQHGTGMNSIHASAMYQSVARLCAAEPGVLQHPQTQQLLQQLENLLQRMYETCSAKETVNIIWAAGQLGCSAPAGLLLPQLLQPALLQELAPRHVSSALFGLSVAKVALSPQQVQQLLSALLQQLQSGVDLDRQAMLVSKSLRSLAAVNATVSAEQLRQLLAAFTEALPIASVTDVALVLWSVSSLCMFDQVPPKQLNAWVEKLKGVAPGASRNEQATLQWATHSLEGRLPELQLQQLKTLVPAQGETVRGVPNFRP
jgi:hypothetical protein